MKKLYIVAYHYVRDLSLSRYPNIKGLDYPLFKEQIEFFKSRFNPVTIEDVEAYYGGDKDALPDDALLLTFDDGYIDHFTYVFPILRENNIQGSFFIPGKPFSENTLLDVNKLHFILASASIADLYNEVLSSIDDLIKNNECPLPSREELLEKYAYDKRFDKKETVFVKQMLQTVLPLNIRRRILSDLFDRYVGVDETVLAHELYLNKDQIRFMKKNGMYIGLHGYEHSRLNAMTVPEMEADIDAALSALSDVVDTGSFIMNYPYGNYNDDVVSCLKRKGCTLSMTVEPRMADPDKDSPLLLPRLDCNDFPPKTPLSCFSLTS